MNKDIKAVEEEICYLRKSIEELKLLVKEKPLEIHYHYHTELYGINPKDFTGKE